MDKDLKNLLINIDFNQIKGLKEAHINILNGIKNSLIKNEQPYEVGWFYIYNKNFTNKKDYGIVNSINLSIISDKEKYKSSEWMTFSQMKKINEKLDKEKQIKLKKGSKGAKIIFCSIYNKLEKKNITEEEYLKIPIEQRIDMERKGDLYFFNKEAVVFNLDCFENIPENMLYIEENKKLDIDYDLVKLLSNEMNLKVYFREQNRAYYNRNDDSITLPSLEQWKNNDLFKATFFHELSHATMHEKRLNRKINISKKKEYSIEEIVAETSSIFLGSKFNYKSESSINNSTKYIEHYSKILIENPKLILNAITTAGMIANYIENIYDKVKAKEVEIKNLENKEYIIENKQNVVNSIKDISDILYETLINDENLQRTVLKSRQILGNNTLADFSSVFQREYARVMREVAKIQGNIPSDIKSLDNVKKLKIELEHRYNEYLIENQQDIKKEEKIKKNKNIER